MIQALEFLLAPFTFVLKTIVGIIKILTLAMMLFLFLGIWIVIWVGWGDEAQRREAVDSILLHAGHSFNSEVMVSALPTHAYITHYLEYPNKPVAEETNNIQEQGYRVPQYCGLGTAAFTRVNQDEKYWIPWYRRKTARMYAMYTYGSLNVSAMRYTVSELKSGATPNFPKNYLDDCPGSAKKRLNDSDVPNIKVEWHENRDSYTPWANLGFIHVDITGYCLSSDCYDNDLQLHIERWRDSFGIEPAYSQNQQNVNAAFRRMGTLEFWEQYAQHNGLDPHSVDEYWRVNQALIKATVNL